MSTSSSTSELTPLEVLSTLFDAIASLQLLEAIYGYVSDNGCKIVGIANELTGEQRDSIWDINWEFQGKHPTLDIEVLLIQRHDCPLSELYNGDSAIIKRITAPA
jgi:hypothetical protein